MTTSSTETIPDTSSASQSNNQIILYVGERKFVTTHCTLTEESGFFSAMLSGRWGSAQPDGSYFVDADPDLFEHILRYLRRRVLQVFYDNAKGHDFALYTALLLEAAFFQIDRLEKWFKDQMYLRAISVHYTTHTLNSVPEIGLSDTEIQYYPLPSTGRAYICPRRIEVHRGDPRRCGRQCRNFQGDAPDEFEEEHKLKFCVVTKTTRYDRAMCIDG